MVAVKLPLKRIRSQTKIQRQLRTIRHRLKTIRHQLKMIAALLASMHPNSARWPPRTSRISSSLLQVRTELTARFRLRARLSSSRRPRSRSTVSFTLSMSVLSSSMTKSWRLGSISERVRIGRSGRRPRTQTLIEDTTCTFRIVSLHIQSRLILRQVSCTKERTGT